MLASQEWHADGPHVGPTAGVDGQREAAPYALCVFVPLQDLRAQPALGCTQFWPGTHKFGHLLGFGPAAAALSATFDAQLPAGWAVAYDYRTLHRGMANAGVQQREVLQFVYHVRTYSEGRNYRGPSLFDGQGSAGALCGVCA